LELKSGVLAGIEQLSRPGGPFINIALTLINAGATVRVTLGSCSGDCGTAITAAGTTSGSGTFVSGIADAASNAASTFTWSAFKFF
jgi:hypothetical protein